MGDTFDDFMESIGLNTKPATPEDALMLNLTEGSANGLSTLHYWLRHELFGYYDLLKHGCIMIKRSDILKKETEFTKIDYARTKIEYYLYMKHMSHFMDGITNVQKCDMSKAVQAVIEHPMIAKLVAAEEDQLVRN